MRFLIPSVTIFASFTLILQLSGQTTQKGGLNVGGNVNGDIKDVHIGDVINNTTNNINIPEKGITKERLKDLDVGARREFLEEKIGKPQAIMKLTKDNFGFDVPGASYCRYQSEEYQIQVIYNAEQNVAIFAVRTTGKSVYQYRTSEQASIDWVIGKSTFSQIEPRGSEERWIFTTARHTGYVEKIYFGKPGGYSDFYFSSALPEDVQSGILLEDNPDSRIGKIDRNSLVPHAVAVCNSNMLKSDITEKEEALVKERMKALVALSGEAYENG